MKKVVRNNAGATATIQAARVGTVSTAATAKPETRQPASAPTPVWTRYVDSRLKHFCMR
jgi:hypothetical protein